MPKPNIVTQSFAGTPQAALINSGGRKLPTPPRKGTVLLDAAGMPRRIEWSTLEDGVKITMNFDFLAKVPGIGMEAARLVANHFDTGSSFGSVESEASALRNGLFGYLRDETRRDMLGPDFERHHLDGLITFLRSQDTVRSVKETRYYSAVRLLKGLAGFDAEVPANPFNGKAFTVSNVLDTPVIYDVLRTAADDVLMRKDRWDAKDDPSHPLWSDPASAAILQLLAELRARFPEGPSGNGVRRLPWNGEIEELAPDLMESFSAIGRSTLADWWGPTCSNIGSSYFLVLYFYRLNPELAKDLRWGENGTIGDETIVNKRKRRAGGIRQLPGYLNGKERLNADVLRRFLRSWTEDLRECAGDARSRVFLYWPRQANAGRRGLTCDLSSNNAPRRALSDFIALYGLPHFTADMVRPTTVELVDISTEGAPGLRTAAGRHTPEVRRRNYTTRDAVIRSLLRLGIAMPIRDRAMRRHHAAMATGRIGGNHVAATPGWNCSNPYYRGFSNAPEGELCDAIGRCPMCKFGRPDLDCVRSYANLLALLEAVRAENVPGREADWIGVYRPIETKIERRWEPAFEQHVRDTPTEDLPHVPSMKEALRWPTF
ncbi:MAG: hypothetical protein V4472_17540 [Pseudomonadota bacterium]